MQRPEERSWGYVQERIDFIQQMRDNIKSKNPQTLQEQTRAQERVQIPMTHTAESSMRAWERPWDTNTEQRPWDIEQGPTQLTQPDRQMRAVMERDRMVRSMISDGNGDSGGMCDGGVCEYKPKPKPTGQIVWKDNNNQASKT
jgi:hypothetical protein